MRQAIPGEERRTPRGRCDGSARTRQSENETDNTSQECTACKIMPSIHLPKKATASARTAALK